MKTTLREYIVKQESEFEKSEAAKKVIINKCNELNNRLVKAENYSQVKKIKSVAHSYVRMMNRVMMLDDKRIIINGLQIEWKPFCDKWLPEFEGLIQYADAKYIEPKRTNSISPIKVEFIDMFLERKKECFANDSEPVKRRIAAFCLLCFERKWIIGDLKHKNKLANNVAEYYFNTNIRVQLKEKETETHKTQLKKFFK